MRTKMRRQFLTGLPVVALFLVAAVHGLFAQDVRYNYDRDADFSKYKTYKWVENKDAAKLDDLRDRQVRSALDAELAKKGFSKVDTDTADVYVSYQVALGQEKQYTSFDSGWGYGRGWRGWGGSGMSTGQTATIHVGALDFDVYDTAQKQLVWEGIVSKALDPKAKPDKQQKNLEKAAVKLLKNYPPPSKK